MVDFGTIDEPNTRDRVTILAFSPIQSDGRVLRQIDYLAGRYIVDVIGYGHLSPALQNRARMHSIQPPAGFARRVRKTLFLPMAKILSKRFYEVWYWSETEYKVAYDLLRQSKARIIHANDWESLPVAVRAAQAMGAHVVLDLHEYAPLLRENRWYWRTFYKPSVDYLMRRYAAGITASVTVNQTLADRYADEYDLHPTVVMNAPKFFADLPFKPTDPRHIRLIHHGIAIRDRKLEMMIEALALADSRYTLHLVLIERSKGYIAELKELACRLAPGRVFFEPPVAPVEIVNRIAEFDIGFCLFAANAFSQVVSLPNKFFDFVMAGLAVCVGPLPEMAHLTRQFGFGVVAPSFDPKSAAELLNQVSADDVDQMKRRAQSARNILNADIELGKLLDVYAELLTGPSVDGVGGRQQ